MILFNVFLVRLRAISIIQHTSQRKDGISYLAMMIPRLAEQIQAPIMKAPCRNISSLDLEVTAPTSPSPRGAPDTI